MYPQVENQDYYDKNTGHNQIRASYQKIPTTYVNVPPSSTVRPNTNYITRFEAMVPANVRAENTKVLVPGPDTQNYQVKFNINEGRKQQGAINLDPILNQNNYQTQPEQQFIINYQDSQEEQDNNQYDNSDQYASNNQYQENGNEYVSNDQYQGNQYVSNNQYQQNPQQQQHGNQYYDTRQYDTTQQFAAPRRVVLDVTEKYSPPSRVIAETVTYRSSGQPETATQNVNVLYLFPENRHYSDYPQSNRLSNPVDYEPQLRVNDFKQLALPRANNLELNPYLLNLSFAVNPAVVRSPVLVPGQLPAIEFPSTFPPSPVPPTTVASDLVSPTSSPFNISADGIIADNARSANILLIK